MAQDLNNEAYDNGRTVGYKEGKHAAAKFCAILVAKNYDTTEPWIDPNVLLRQFGLPEWELIDGAWYDPETGVSYYF